MKKRFVQCLHPTNAPKIYCVRSSRLSETGSVVSKLKANHHFWMTLLTSMTIKTFLTKKVPTVIKEIPHFLQVSAMKNFFSVAASYQHPKKNAWEEFARENVNCSVDWVWKLFIVWPPWNYTSQYQLPFCWQIKWTVHLNRSILCAHKHRIWRRW